MRIYLKLTSNTEICPFNYQGYLVQKFHEWTGGNNIHDEISLYSFSWLRKGDKVENGFNFPNGAEWFISAYDTNLIKAIINGIKKNPSLSFGMSVKELTIFDTPEFSRRERFVTASPIFIKRSLANEQKFYYHFDPISPKLLTETLQSKLKKANLNLDVNVQFDRNYSRPKIKGVLYKEHMKKASACPVVIEGDPEAIRFAWDVGVGSNTGIGFGALI